jgi:hypothetical protein
MNEINQRMLKLLGWGWLGFLIAGIVISLAFPIPSLVVLIDRSYCNDSARWQQVVNTYTNLYQQHQWKTLNLQKVILFSDLAQESIPPPPPENIQNLKTYGRQNLQQLENLQKDYPKSQLLTCQL